MKYFLIATLSLLFIGSNLFAQAPREILIDKIDISEKQAPKYNLNGSDPKSESSRKWVIIEAELQSLPDWADEVTLKYYVAVNYDPNTKINGVPVSRLPADQQFDVLEATVTIVNMERNAGTGKKNIVPVFMDSNTRRRYNSGALNQFIPEVAVEVYYKGVPQDRKWMKSEQRSGRFWERKPPRRGILLNLTQSPWWPAFSEHYEQVKPVSSAPAL